MESLCLGLCVGTECGEAYWRERKAAVMLLCGLEIVARMQYDQDDAHLIFPELQSFLSEWPVDNAGFMCCECPMLQ